MRNPLRCITNPSIRPLLDDCGRTVDDEWIVCDPLVWTLSDGQALAVPAGFITDLASIPTMLRPFLSPTGKSRRPAIAHDFLYSSNLWSRRDADEFLRVALILEGVSIHTARLYWLGVRAGGWRYYNKRKAGLTGDDFGNIGASCTSAS